MGKYLRTVCFATLRQAFHAPLLLAADGYKSVDTSEIISRGALDEKFHDREVFVFKEQDSRANLYAWLSPTEFELLSSSSGEAMLQEWVDLLAPSVEKAMERIPQRPI